MTLKVGLVGYGKMGKEIEIQAANMNVDITTIANSFDEVQKISRKNCDVVIEFTHSDSACHNIKHLLSEKVPVVSGTTGWESELETMKNIAQIKGVGFFWASNFSIGVNTFWRIIEQASQMVDQLDEYDVFAHEWHHSQKKDSPSGTAMTTASIIQEKISRKKSINYEIQNGIADPSVLHVSSTRGGSIPGTHSVFFDSPADTIEITHRARNRSGFAKGALQAAKFIKEKRGFYTMKDLLEYML